MIGPRDPLWGRPAAKPVSLAALADRSWILFPTTHGLSQVVAEACARAGFSPRPAVTTQQFDAAVRLAAAGVGVALVPDNVVPAELQPSVRRLRRPLVRELTAYTRSEWSPPARAFVDVLRGLSRSRRPRNADVTS